MIRDRSLLNIYALCLHLLEAGRSSKPSFGVWFLLFKLVLEALEGAGQNTTWRMGAVSPLQDSWGAWTNPSCLWIVISQCTVTASSAAGVHILAFHTHGSLPSSPLLPLPIPKPKRETAVKGWQC